MRKMKTISTCLAAALTVSMLAGGAVSAFAAPAETEAASTAVVSTETCISGSWKRASDPTLTPKVRNAFEKAFAGLKAFPIPRMPCWPPAPRRPAPSTACCARPPAAIRMPRKSMWWSP